MKSKLLLCFGGLAMLSSMAMASPVTCQSVLLVGNGNFGQMIAVGACDVGNVTVSDFNTTFTASSVLASMSDFTGSPFGSIIGSTYSWLSGVVPGGGAGSTATFDPAEGTACPVGLTCGIDGVETQLNSILGNVAVVTTN